MRLMKSSLSPEERRKKRERYAIIALVFLLLIIGTIEVQVLKTSVQLPFLSGVFFFGLMNLNIVLIMILLFLVFRNVVKLVLDETRKKKGKTLLKTRLVFSFILFALIPTFLLFLISALYIKSSFDKYFSIKAEGALKKSIDVVKNYYETLQMNATHFSKLVASGINKNFKVSELSHYLTQVQKKYLLDAIEYYETPFSNRIVALNPKSASHIPPVPLKRLEEAFYCKNDCTVNNVGAGELIRCSLCLNSMSGVIFTSYFVPIDMSSQLSDISFSYKEFKKNNPFSYPMKSTYFGILVMVTLLILFSAIWTGFYVARMITIPIDQLVRGTSEVASGNLEYKLTPSGSYEFRRLIELFNKMTSDLKTNTDELKVAYSNLSHRQRYIEVLVENLKSGVLSFDKNGKVSMVNQAALELLSMPNENLIGKHFFELFLDSRFEELRAVINEVFEKAEFVHKELTLKKEMVSVNLLITANQLKDLSGGLLGVLLVIDNVTDIKKIERVMAWREVARRMAHEIKNPLTPIYLSIERLKRRYLDKTLDKDTFTEATNIVLNEVNDLKNMVDVFSSFARLPASQKSINNLNDIILETVNFFRAAHENITFNLELDESIPPLELDGSQFKQALVNLFDNAVDAMDGKGCIKIKSSLDEDFYKLYVIDSGCGIKEGDYEQIFEPYYSTKKHGTGLGLSIVQNIVIEHGGKIYAIPNPDGGSIFIIELHKSLSKQEVNLEQETKWS